MFDFKSLSYYYYYLKKKQLVWVAQVVARPMQWNGYKPTILLVGPCHFQF
jgi:hypothetical protein